MKHKNLLEEMIRSEDWVRYYDEEHSSYYLYNEKTGESVWEVDFMQAVDEFSQEHPDRTSTKESKNSRKKSTAKTFRSKDFSRDSPLTPAEQIQFDLLCYSRFLFANATVVEAPLTILEALCRIVAMAVIGVIVTVYLLCRGKRAKAVGTVVLYVREIILAGAAMLSLAVPGLICAIYWSHNHETEWDLQPLPTILGKVDMRRFAVITYGGGALASNVAHYTGVAHDDTDADAVDPIITGKGARRDGPRGRRMASESQDSWPGRLIWVPRELAADCALFMSGGDRLDSIDVAL